MDRQMLGATRAEPRTSDTVAVMRDGADREKVGAFLIAEVKAPREIVDSAVAPDAITVFSSRGGVVSGCISAEAAGQDPDGERQAQISFLFAAKRAEEGCGALVETLLAELAARGYGLVVVLLEPHPGGAGAGRARRSLAWLVGLYEARGFVGYTTDSEVDGILMGAPLGGRR